MEKIIFLIVLSGLISWVGDKIGKKLGKKRISLFGLRPRNTAVVITILTGSLITLLTVGLMALMFKNVWIALFNVPQLMEKVTVMRKELEKTSDSLSKAERRLSQMREKMAEVKQKITLKEKEIRKREKEIEELKLYRDNLQVRLNGLQKEINEKILKIRDLEKELERKEEGILVYRNGEPISVAVIKTGLSPKEVLNSIKYFLKKTREVALKNGLTVAHQNYEELWKKIKGDFGKVAQKIAKSKGEMVIGFVASSHLFKGDRLKGDFKMKPNSVLYRAGDKIYSFYIDGTQCKDKIYSILKYYLENMYLEIRDKGRLGEVKVDELQFFNLLNKIIGKKVEVIVIAKKDIKVEGELALKFEVKEKEADVQK